ncbi:DUF542 domain-containing protein [Belnapia sp. T18]|uniref:DUF542 domain-containing protein n=1 Tax=Belnapia arida TaxID=2804533 RepID=A0ABS1U0H7_9PROT|nr:DUF542 domain-containing protein [Belnapia arida]MBL6078179.1 DUF542 domain-containing protein [Belnapia arida]
MTETLAPAAGAYAARPVAGFAASLPGATAVFRLHKIDVCCGGQAPLAEAVAAPGADLGAVEEELAALVPGGAMAPEATEELIALIETRYHATHRRELPELEHMQKEEQVLFPLMRRGGHPMIGHPIGMMRHEHDSHGAQLRTLDALTTGGVPPAGACNTWRALYAGTRKLTDDLMEHIHPENNALFPRFGA